LDDISSRRDIDDLLRAFYGRVYADPLLAPIFVDVAHMDLEQHLPVIGDFWERVLFNTGRYGGGAMEVHRRLHRLFPLTSEHFERWLELWTAAVDGRHHGTVSEAAKQHARRIAVAIERNLAALDAVRTPVSQPTG
jgi:hemoglobin